jgi:hypothetical protein
VLSETPKIYGAEHLLTRRPASLEFGEKLANGIRWSEEQAVAATERRPNKAAGEYSELSFPPRFGQAHQERSVRLRR